MVEYCKVNVKFPNRQQKQLKIAAKSKKGTTLKISLKMFDGNDLSHELFLIGKRKVKKYI